MLREEKNLKDPEGKLPASYGASTQSTSVMPFTYTKTDKLITALYMVTDIIDKDEPLRNKLRTLGTGIISDTHTAPANICIKVSEIMSFLDIASAINIISEMNCNILRKEFGELDQSIREFTGNLGVTSKPVNLSEFLREELPAPKQIEQKYHSIGHHSSTRIGVQKGATLLKAIKDMSDKMPAPYEAKGFRLGSDTKKTDSFDILKKQRRAEIINLTTKQTDGATITDIKTKAYGSLVSCSEKTLQRELISMLKDGVLYKTGEKRWSKYFVK